MNFFLVCVISVVTDMQPFYPSDYHSTNHLTPAVNSIQTPMIPASSGNSPPNVIANNSGCLTKYNDIDALNPNYTSYNNWSNGYNNYQYAGPVAPATAMQTPTQSQYAAAGPPQVPHATPTMLIYPQVYSTVNQNQIHLHLHGTDKIEQYLNTNENGLALNPVRNANTEIGLNDSSESQNVIMDNDESEAHHHRNDHEATNRDDEVGDPSSVWRPY